MFLPAAVTCQCNEIININILIFPYTLKYKYNVATSSSPSALLTTKIIGPSTDDGSEPGTILST